MGAMRGRPDAEDSRRRLWSRQGRLRRHARSWRWLTRPSLRWANGRREPRSQAEPLFGSVPHGRSSARSLKRTMASRRRGRWRRGFSGFTTRLAESENWNCKPRVPSPRPRPPHQHRLRRHLARRLPRPRHGLPPERPQRPAAGAGRAAGQETPGRVGARARGGVSDFLRAINEYPWTTVLLVVAVILIVATARGR